MIGEIIRIVVGVSGSPNDLGELRDVAELIVRIGFGARGIGHGSNAAVVETGGGGSKGEADVSVVRGRAIHFADVGHGGDATRHGGIADADKTIEDVV